MTRRLLISLLVIPVALVAVEIGDSKHQLLTEFGPPRSTIGIGEREILTYESGKVVLVSGKVSAIEGKLTASLPSASSVPAPKASTP